MKENMDIPAKSVKADEANAVAQMKADYHRPPEVRIAFDASGVVLTKSDLAALSRGEGPDYK